MFKNVILFPHRGGQLKTGVEKAPFIFKHFFNNTLNVIETETDEKYFFNNIKNLYYENKKIHGRRINFGGDHSMSIATVADSLNRYNKELKVLWIDAHCDLNTYESSDSKNYHGMPLSFLTGLDYNSNFDFIKNNLSFDNLMYIGIRDIDPFEKEQLEKYNIKYVKTDQLKESYDMINRFVGSSPLHVSFDVDSMYHRDIPCTGTPVNGGIPLNQGIELIKFLMNKNIVSFDITEINLDLGNSINKITSFNNIIRLFKKPLF